MKYVKRSIEDIVLQSEKTFKSILVTGARQTGKSTMLKELFPEKKYVPMDDPFVEEQAKEQPNMFMMLNPPPVIYDEVQRTPELFRYIKIKCDQSQERGLFCLSGSQPLELMEGASESLSGRVSIIELSGLSMREIQGDAFHEPFVPTMEYVQERSKTVKPFDHIWEIIHRGSYPELQDPQVEWSAFFSSYIKTYLERDVRELSAVQNLDDFRKFMIAVAARTGQMVNYANIADEVGKDQTTIKRWMSVLEASGIIYLLEPFTSSVLKRAIKTPKVYFRDTGLAAYLTRWLTPETLANGAMSGAFFETFVISEILKSYSNRGIDYRYCVSYYRGRDKKVKGDSRGEREIDLIIEANGILYPIEIKKGASVSADQTSAFTILDQIPDKKRGMGAIICLCPQPGALRENILQLPIWYI
ncbi:ATP-binding protein [Ihubacter massiliensis]|uniref:ATP-binding protein n=1 Tax=Hominibacterium faecale TaxID=2839743 RepID=A0A9J6QKJ7_9FIRM|nr:MULTISPECIES: ATP-binding protein [Eubacteriales Family XIII. Incertae Sedis]MCO7121092.1 ATP-binding protein [Ihubacter massiliensis]MCU7378008.1 ATP-binding protein [Hominibacterium faecale]